MTTRDHVMDNMLYKDGGFIRNRKIMFNKMFKFYGVLFIVSCKMIAKA